MRLESQVDPFILYLDQVLGLSAHTLKAYRSDVGEFLHLMDLRGKEDLGQITIVDLRSWMAHEDQTHSRSTMARKTVAIRRFFAYAQEQGLIEANPASALATPRIPQHLPQVLNEQQAADLMEQADSDAREAEEQSDKSGEQEGSEPPSAQHQALALRDDAMLELLYATGMRVAELTGLNLSSIDADQRTVRVMGKGSKERVVPFGLPALKAVQAWVDEGRPVLAAHRKSSQESDDEQALFLGAQGRRVGQRQVRDVVHQLAGQAHLPSISPHALRHSAATHLLDGGLTCVKSRRCWDTLPCAPPNATRMFPLSSSVNAMSWLSHAPKELTLRDKAATSSLVLSGN
ncbi:tyrosine recombinase XerC [Bombiscardovia nodaiensis]|uniref:Tyrosine recombinase XerC n=1 Tax=Bombiscardovia nodaiensis TaxID=2932181 RepID=A0ABM8B8H2_9BIFI|nr:tyrosine recombinase XerC [Bombiscardovia nodaiensis]